jgi:hypothetical protein
MTTKRTSWQRRVPRALVHRERPRGWAHVTCGGHGQHHNRSPGGRGRRQPHTRVGRTHRCPPPPPHRRTSSQPQPGRARAAPAAHACRSGASLPHAETAPEGGALGDAERHRALPCATPVVPSIGGTCKRRGGFETRPYVHPESPGTRRMDRTTGVARLLASGNDACDRHECAAGAARALPGCGWQPVLAPRVVASGNDVAKRHACAAGAARALPGCGCDVAHGHHKLHAPSPVASLDAQVRDGPRRCPVLPVLHHLCNCSAATGAHAVRHTRGRGASMERVAGHPVSCSAQRPDERLPREKGRPAPFLLAGVQGQSPAGGAGGSAPRRTRWGKAPTGVQGQRPAGDAGAAPRRGCRGSAPPGMQGQSPARQQPLSWSTRAGAGRAPTRPRLPRGSCRRSPWPRRG